LRNKIRPKEQIDGIRPYLPSKYSPLQQTGDGKQGVYLAHISDDLAGKLLGLIGEEVDAVLIEGSGHSGETLTDHEAEEDRAEKIIKKDNTIPHTVKEALVNSRRGQGRFREGVISLQIKCPFTSIENPSFLRAGHLKPWAVCDNHERLDPRNGLALSPVADLLVDQGYVSFDDAGVAVFSTKVDAAELKSMGIDPDKSYKIDLRDDAQRTYIAYHRTHVFKK